MAKVPEIIVHRTEPEPVVEELEPLGPDETYELRFSFATTLGGHPIPPGDVVGSLFLKYGVSPELFASLLGRGIIAEIDKKKTS